MVRPKRHSRPGYVSPGVSTHNRPSSHKGALAWGMSRPGKAPTTAPHHTKGLSPWVWHARGNHPQPPLGTQRGSGPGYDSPGESTHIRPTGGPLSPRYTGFQQPPQGPAWPGETTYTTSKSSLYTNGVLLPNTQVGRVSLLTMEVLPPHSGLCRYIGWPVETGRTIH